MEKKTVFKIVLGLITALSLAVKLILIFKYKNLLTLASDDLNYIKCAVILLNKGIFTYQNVNEPTVFVMPFYPLFLAGVFKVMGYGIAGIQAVRVVQAVFSCVTVVLVYLTAECLFNKKVAIVSAFLVAFYIPNITTSGYLLTETVFTTFLYLLIYLSLEFSKAPNYLKFITLGVIWTVSALCRPTIALYPVILFMYLVLYRKLKFLRLLKLSAVMALTFVILMSPWWIRNYTEVGEFIPLTASSGNPMLQGTYIDYHETPENVVYYKLGNNALETNKIEVSIAKERIIRGFKEDFWGYLKWYTLGKTYKLWYGAFYWKEYLGMSQQAVLIMHRFLLLGFVGLLSVAFRNPLKYLILISVIAYFNAIHCLYMSFDRYSFPLMPIISIFFSFLFFEVPKWLRGAK